MLEIIDVYEPEATLVSEMFDRVLKPVLYSNRPKCLPGKCLNSLSTGNASRNFQESFFVQSI